MSDHPTISAHEATVRTARLTTALRRAIPHIAEMHTTWVPVPWSDGVIGHTFVASIRLQHDPLDYATSLHLDALDAADLAHWVRMMGEGLHAECERSDGAGRVGVWVEPDEPPPTRGAAESGDGGS